MVHQVAGEGAESDAAESCGMIETFGARIVGVAEQTERFAAFRGLDSRIIDQSFPDSPAAIFGQRHQSVEIELLGIRLPGEIVNLFVRESPSEYFVSLLEKWTTQTFQVGSVITYAHSRRVAVGISGNAGVTEGILGVVAGCQTLEDAVNILYRIVFACKVCRDLIAHGGKDSVGNQRRLFRCRVGYMEFSRIHLKLKGSGVGVTPGKDNRGEGRMRNGVG